MLDSVISSPMVHVVPTWSKALKNKKGATSLLGVQRLAKIRITCAYRTIFAVGCGTIAGVRPIELLVIGREQVGYNALEKKMQQKSLPTLASKGP